MGHENSPTHSEVKAAYGVIASAAEAIKAELSIEHPVKEFWLAVETRIEMFRYQVTADCGDGEYYSANGETLTKACHTLKSKLPRTAELKRNLLRRAKLLEEQASKL